MLRIGLTGGISTGKSTVAQIIRTDFAVPVIDADAASREIVLPGQPALAAIEQHFGSAVIQDTGHLNRSALGTIIMADPAQRQALEDITHPRIRAHLQHQLESHAQAGAAVAVVEAALIVETGSAAAYDKLLVVSCSPSIQRQRLMQRNGFSQEEAQKWMNNQLPLAEKEALADVVIYNNGDPIALRAEVHKAWRELGL
jgi:dephospho-CoA kinase